MFILAPQRKVFVSRSSLPRRRSKYPLPASGNKSRVECPWRFGPVRQSASKIIQLVSCRQSFTEHGRRNEGLPAVTNRRPPREGGVNQASGVFRVSTCRDAQPLTGSDCHHPLTNPGVGGWQASPRDDRMNLRTSGSQECPVHIARRHTCSAFAVPSGQMGCIGSQREMSTGHHAEDCIDRRPSRIGVVTVTKGPMARMSHAN
jgi:hypothetical protein